MAYLARGLLWGGFVASLVFCILLVLTKSWHGVFSMDANEGVQKFHSTPTPRIGELAEDTHFRIMLILQENPDLTQRELAKKLGMSLGGLDYSSMPSTTRAW